MTLELPKAFVERIRLQYPSEYLEFLESLKKTPNTSIRLNPTKNLSLETKIERVPWNSNGYFLPERPTFYLDPNFHNGRYYVQDSSSMFIQYILEELNPKNNFKNILDLCAAPGGKSTILLDSLTSEQTLVANEIIPKRNLVLRENLTKWGNPQFIITQNAPKDFENSKFKFDLILVDAPCSGEGMFRKDPEAIQEWSEKNVAKCVKRQTEIIENAWNALNDGGILIYSTCTFNPEENELQVQKLLENYPDSRCLSIDTSSYPEIRVINQNGVLGYSFLPHLVRGEGFFVSIIQKGDISISKPSSSNSSKSHINSQLAPYLADKYQEGYSTFKFQNNLFLSSNHTLDILPSIQSNLYIKQVGIDIGKINQDEIELSHGLSMLPYQSKNILTIELNKEESLDYLAQLPLSTLPQEEGFYQVLFDKYPLGWIQKKKGKEINLYPSNLRLKRRY